MPLGEGVKQGDATSSLFFCLGVDTPLGKISAYLQEHNIDAEVYMYMDDLTICVETDHANGVAQATIDAFHSIGLMINEAKSKILTDAVGSFILPRCSHAEEFIVLGVNLAEGESAKRAFTERLLRRQQDYFALFKKVSLHPQAVTTLLRVCGHPRITYFCATVPPPDMVATTSTAKSRKWLNSSSTHREQLGSQRRLFTMTLASELHATDATWKTCTMRTPLHRKRMRLVL